MIEQARIEAARLGQASTAELGSDTASVEDERSMRVLEWALAALAIVAAVGLAFVR